MLLFFLLFTPIYSLIITTPLGQIRGKDFTARDGTIVRAFKRVPFAEPPVKELRFALPAPKRPWKGVWDGTEYGPACISNSTRTSSPQKWVDEDCLHNNIFTSERCLESKDCPVVLYIHGGAFQMDSSVMFDDDTIVSNFGSNDIVMVISAFRLGSVGLLNLGNENVIPFELPLHDIIASLEWVQGNIHAFGGNPRSVTLFGHSFGAHTVTALAFSPVINPDERLFQKVVGMSGVGLLNVMQDIDLQKLSWEFSRRVGCVTYPSYSDPSENYLHEVLGCLRTINQSVLLSTQRKLEEEGSMFYGLFPKDEAFPRFHDSLKNPPKIPMMLGTTLFEMDKYNKSDSEYFVTVADDVGLRYPLAAVEKYHQDEKEKRLDFSHDSMTQMLFVRNYLTASTVSKAGAPVYLYSYRNKRHSKHTDDLSYIMGVHKFDQDENEKVLAELYPKYFINFIKTGVPDPEWEPFHPENGNYFAIDVNVTTGLRPKNALHYEKPVINYWLRDLPAFDQALADKKKISSPGISLKSSKFPFSMTKRAERNISDALGMLRSILIVFGIMLAGYLLGRYLGSLNRDDEIRIIDENRPLLK